MAFDDVAVALGNEGEWSAFRLRLANDLKSMLQCSELALGGIAMQPFAP